MGTCISAVAFALPERRITNEEVARFVRWTPEQILEKTGIAERRAVSDTECASDLAVAAAEALFGNQAARADRIDFLVFVSQGPDYLLPPTSCTLQARLGLPTGCATLDLSHGCSGYVYGLAVAHAWISAGFGERGLVLTGDTYTRFIRPEDTGTRPIFGDAGTASLVERIPTDEGLGAFVFGTDGTGADKLIVRVGGLRHPAGTPEGESSPHLFMDGPSIFRFTLDAVPQAVADCLALKGCGLGDVDLYLMHQANQFMVRHLGDKIGIPPERIPIGLERVGNTVSSSIPILLADMCAAGAVRSGMRLMLVGFGVGFSWAACMLDIGQRVPQGVLPAE